MQAPFKFSPSLIGATHFFCLYDLSRPCSTCIEPNTIALEFVQQCGGGALCQPPCPRAGKPKTTCRACGGSALCRAPCSREGELWFAFVGCVW